MISKISVLLIQKENKFNPSWINKSGEAGLELIQSRNCLSMTYYGNIMIKLRDKAAASLHQYL